MQPPPTITTSADDFIGGGGGERVRGSGFGVLGWFWFLGSWFWVRGSGFWVLGSGKSACPVLSMGMIARHYRELECWQLSNELKRRVYAFLAKTPAKNDFDFCKQIRGDSAQ